MINNLFQPPESQAFHEGKEQGFKIAESYVEDLIKKFYKDVKRGLLKQMATTTTTSNHKCNCEFCKFND